MKIIVYGAEGCGVCKNVREFLDNNSISYTYKNVGTDITIEDFIEKFKVQSVPIVIIDGRTFFGFSPSMKTLIKEKIEQENKGDLNGK